MTVRNPLDVSQAALRAKVPTKCALMTLPSCPSGHGQMKIAPAGSSEQAFCGTWYRCIRCTSSVLLESPGLRAQLDEQNAAA